MVSLFKKCMLVMEPIICVVSFKKIQWRGVVVIAITSKIVCLALGLM